MDSTFSRGQRSFLARAVSLLHNIFILLILSFVMGFSVSILVLWNTLSEGYWQGQAMVHRIAKQIFFKGGLFSLSEAIDYYFSQSFENFSFHQDEFGIGFFWGALGAVSFFFLAGAFFIRRGKMLESAKIIRGSELLSPSAYNRGYKAFLKEKSRFKIFQPSTYRLNRFKTLFGTPFVCGKDRLVIPEDSLYRHMAVLGATGVGKTTLIDSYLEYCRNRGEKVIIPDINAEYASRFFPSRGCHSESI